MPGRESIDCARATWGAQRSGVQRVGKGDMKTRRGKIYRGSFGKSRPKHPGGKQRAAKATSTTGSPARKQP